MADVDRVSQLAVETVMTPDTSARVSQLAVETLMTPSALARVSQLVVEALGPYSVPARVSQLVLEVASTAYRTPYVVIINGQVFNPKLESIEWNRVQNSGDQLAFDIISEDRSYRPAVTDEVFFLEMGARVLGGYITSVDEIGYGLDGIIQRVTVNDYKMVVAKRSISQTIAAGTLKQQLQQIIDDILIDNNITLDATQADGPDIPEQVFDETQASEALNQILEQAPGWVWTITPFKTLLATEVVTVLAPFDVDDNSTNETNIGEQGMMVSRRLDDTFANRVIVKVNGNGDLDSAEQFTAADGITDGGFIYFYAKYPGSNSQMDPWPNELTFDGVDQGPIGRTVDGVPTNAWDWDTTSTPARLRYTIASAAAFPTGSEVIDILYRARFPFTVQADDLVSQAGPLGIIEMKREVNNALTYEGALALAESLLANAVDGTMEVQYRTLNFGLRLGQTQSIQSTKRDIDDDFLITTIRSRQIGDKRMLHTVTAVRGDRFKGSYLTPYKSWFGVGA